MVNDSANVAGNWQGFLNQIIQGGIDYARLKHLDVPRALADSNVPDQADLYYGNTLKKKPGEITVGAWLLIGALVLGGGFALYRFLK